MIFKKISCMVVLSLFLIGEVMPPFWVQANDIASLPKARALLEPVPKHLTVTLRGLTIDRADPLNFQFCLDGTESHAFPEAAKMELPRLIHYFLAALTVPETDLFCTADEKLYQVSKKFLKHTELLANK